MLAAITEMLERDPFQPFRIVLTNGNRYDVVTPHLVAIGETQIFYYYPSSDRFAYLRQNQIAAVESLNGA